MLCFRLVGMAMQQFRRFPAGKVCVQHHRFETEFCDQLLLINTWGWGGVQCSLVRDMLVTKGGRGLGNFGIGTCFPLLKVQGHKVDILDKVL